MPIPDHSSREVAGFIAQLDDLCERLLRDLEGITAAELEWQPQHGANTIGMLLASGRRRAASSRWRAIEHRSRLLAGRRLQLEHRDSFVREHSTKALCELRVGRWLMDRVVGQHEYVGVPGAELRTEAGAVSHGLPEIAVSHGTEPVPKPGAAGVVGHHLETRGVGSVARSSGGVEPSERRVGWEARREVRVALRFGGGWRTAGPEA